MPSLEGGFHICRASLIEAHARASQQDEAMELFEKLIARAGPTGLYSEEFDPVAGVALGNHPQAYSHLGLIRAAIAISRLMVPNSASARSADSIAGQ